MTTQKPVPREVGVENRLAEIKKRQFEGLPRLPEHFDWLLAEYERLKAELDGANASAKYEHQRADGWVARYKELYNCVRVEPLHSSLEKERDALRAELEQAKEVVEQNYFQVKTERERADFYRAENERLKGVRRVIDALESKLATVHEIIAKHGCGGKDCGLCFLKERLK